MPRIKTFQDGDTLEALDEAWLDEIVARSHIRQGTGNGGVLSGWVDGGAHVLILSMGLGKPASGVATYVIDSSIDWRDRVVEVLSRSQSYPAIVSPTVVGGSEPLFYTGPGKAEGAGAGEWSIQIGSSNEWLAVSEDDGSLLVEIDAASGSANHFWFFVLRASEQLGLRSSPGTRETPFAADGGNIGPTDLNAAQDCGLLRQASQGRRGVDRAASASYEPRPIHAVPIGPVVGGDPPLPISQKLEEKMGWDPAPTFEARQNVVGEVLRAFSVAVANNSLEVVDGSVDWRDRLVQLQARYSSSDIRPGQSGDTGFNASLETTNPALYSGKGHPSGTMPDNTDAWAANITTAGDLKMYVDESTGNLIVRNETGGTRYLAGMVQGTQQLGFKPSK